MIGSIGGTFNILHEGHKDYIKTAFRFCEFVYIMLTTNKYTQKKYQVKSFNLRKKQIVEYLKSLNIKRNKYKFIKIDNTKSLIGFMTKTNINLVITSHEYYPLMKLINDIKIIKKLKPFLILIKERLGISTTQLIEKNNNEM